MRIAVVTGASSGLGRAYAKALDKTVGLDELWLIARREERLIELSGELDHPCRILPLDLTEEKSLETLEALLGAEKPWIKVLVSCAGFGKFGRARDLSHRETGDMVDLNCRAAVEVTGLYIPYLRRGSRVLEVCSCAGFQPLPGMSLYAATKAFLLSYTRSLGEELKEKGIKVTAVCPFWIKTEFMTVARDTANPQAVKHTPFAMRPEAVAAWSLTMNSLGAAVTTCGPIPAAMRLGSKVLPTQAVMAAWDKLRKL